MKSTLRTVANRFVPGLMNKRYLRHATPTEPEIRLLPVLVPCGGQAIDVGANRGLFVHHLLKLTPDVVAFEPLPPMLDLLKRNYGASIRIEPVALSDTAEGLAEIRYPRGNHAWATIASANALELAQVPIESTVVPLKTLDSYHFERPRFIKVDVEGHEESVLRGAHDTLARARPDLLIEIEERHNEGATTRVPAFLRTLGYEGFFLDGGRVRKIEEFNAAQDQPKGGVSSEGKLGRYVNNFIFSTSVNAGEKLQSCASGQH